MSNKKRTSKRNPKVPLKFNDHIMGNQSQRKTIMEQCENIDEIKVFRVNNNDSDDNCDEMRDGGSNARDEVIRDEREHSIDINECNVSPYKLRNDDNIDKYVDNVQEKIVHDCFVHDIHSEKNALCDYHNMVAILEKNEQNVDFHPILDFVEASHIRYALTFNPNVYVSHIRQFWSTARIETTEEGTKILATIDGISSLPDAELFENLTLMGYNISPNRKFTFQKGQFSHQLKYLIHTIMQCLSPKSTGFNEFSSNIATALCPIPTVTLTDTPQLRHYTRRARIAQFSALSPVADEPASPIGDVSQGEACLTVSGLEAKQDRANIIKTSTLPSDSTPGQQTELVSKFEAQKLEITRLKARIKLLEDKDKGVAEPSGEDAPIKRRRLDEGEEAAKRVCDDTEEMATVLTSMDATSILTSGGVHVVPTATVIYPYTRRKGKEKMVESDTPRKKNLQEQIDVQVARELEEEMAREAQRLNEQVARDAEIARLRAEEELQMMIDGLDRSNETVAKYLQEYYQFATELPIERRIELISDLVKYQDNYAKVLKYQTRQRKPLTKKQQREFKRKGIRFEQESVKKLKTSEEVKETEKVPEEKVKEMIQLVPVEEVYVEALQVKHPIVDWKVHTEGHRSYWKIIRLEGSSASYQFFVDMLKHLDREDLNQL
nr:hypothetical protein [Tanacetum cinerariifolium]